MYSSKKLNVELWPPSLFKSTRNNPPVHILILTHRGSNKVSYSQTQKGQPSQTLCWFAPSKFWCSSPPGGLHTERGNFASPRTAPPRKSSSRINTTPFVFHFSGNPHLRCTNRQNQQGHLEWVDCETPAWPACAKQASVALLLWNPLYWALRKYDYFNTYTQMSLRLPAVALEDRNRVLFVLG